MGFLRGKKDKEINKVVLLPLREIDRNPNQPRKYFDPEDLQELSRSIAANGLLQPVTVRKMESGRYELIAGERRTMAFRELGKEHIPAIVEQCSDEQSAVMSLIENLQRKNLNYFEEAAGIARLMGELDLSQQQISARLGKAQSTVANKLRLLRYSTRVQEEMLRRNMTERHARALLKVPDEALQLEAVAYISDKNLNVDQTERYIESLLVKHEPPAAHNRMFVVKDVRIFLNSIQKAVNMMDQAGIKVETGAREDEEFLEYTIRIPKDSAFQRAKEKSRGAASSV